MLVSVNDVANRLKISNRAVQIKCKRQGLVKIGNQYQITEEIVENWMNKSEAKQRNESEHTRQISHPKQRNTISFYTILLYIVLALLLAISILFYFNLDTQIKTANETIKINTIEHKKDLKELNKRLNDAHDVIQNQELEIQSLKLKDSLRYIRRW